MGRIGLEDLERFNSGNGKGGFFKLSNDKDVARVRLMLDKPNDIENYMFSVHDVEIDGKHRYVNCLRDYNDPIEKCPFCEAKKKVIPKIYIPLYNIDTDEMQVWDRGKKFMSTLTSFMSRYAKPSLVSHVVEIERNGAAGDMQTTYQLYETDKDDTKLEDLEEFPEVLGWVVLDKSEDDMNYYLDTGEFPPEEEESQPIRRRGSHQRQEEEEVEEEVPFEEEEEETPQRRTSRRSDAGSSRRTPGTSKRRF